MCVCVCVCVCVSEGCSKSNASHLFAWKLKLHGPRLDREIEQIFSYQTLFLLIVITLGDGDTFSPVINKGHFSFLTTHFSQISGETERT